MTNYSVDYRIFPECHSAAELRALLNIWTPWFEAHGIDLRSMAVYGWVIRDVEKRQIAYYGWRLGDKGLALRGSEGVQVFQLESAPLPFPDDEAKDLEKSA